MILVYGYGISGRGAVQLLLAQGKRVAVYEDDLEVDLPCSVTDMRGKSSDEILDEVEEIVISPSVKPTDNILLQKALLRGINVISEIELAYRYCLSRIITVTGTNGKTTTVRLITDILQRAGLDARAVGNIGVSFCGELADMNEESIAVVEASSFQLAWIKDYTSDIAVCLNVSTDHLEYHGTFADYLLAKSNVLKGQNTDQFAVLNYNDCNVRDMDKLTAGKVYYTSTDRNVLGAYMAGGNICYDYGGGEVVLCQAVDIPLKGVHNIENVLASIAVAKIMDIPDDVINEALADFVPSPFRMQYTGQFNGVRYYNDSKSTNISSTLSACRSVKGKTVLLMGGYDKGLCYKDMFIGMPDNICQIVAFGANRDMIAGDMFAAGECIPLILADGITEAIKIAIELGAENILFSPATSSYDQFADYMDRGRYFDRAVREVTGVQR